MAKLDPKTGYPRGFVEGWWRCPECGTQWHDSAQKGCQDVSWDHPPFCGAGDCSGNIVMERVCDGPLDEPPEIRTAQARLDRAVEALREIAEAGSVSHGLADRMGRTARRALDEIEANTDTRGGEG